MASLDQLKTALRNAEARGATQDAALLANAIKERTPAPPRDRAAEEAARNLRLAQLEPGGIGQGIAEFGKGILGGAAGILETGAIGAADFLVPDAFDDMSITLIFICYHHHPLFLYPAHHYFLHL